MSNVFPSDPGYDAAAVTPSDTDQIGNARSLYVGGDGNVKIDTAKGNEVTFSGVVAGTVLPVRATRVYSTGTTATNIVAIY